MAFAGFLAALFFAPLAFGTTETWSTVTAQLLVTLTCVFLSLLERRNAAFYQVPGLTPLLGYLAWPYLQCVPLPVSWVRQVAPGTVAAYQPVLDLLPPDTWIPLSVNQQATLLEALRFTAYGLFYLLTVQLLVSRRRLSITITSIAGLTLFIAFAAMLQRAAAPDTLFWLRTLKTGYGSFGPWVYKNQYAGFMVMTCPLLLALFLLHRPIADESASFREKLLHLFSGSGASQHLFWGFGVIVVIASVLLAQSRGGFLSLSFALGLFFLLLARRQRSIQTLPLLFLLAGLLLAGGWFSWAAMIERFDQAFDTASGTLQDGRLRIWQDAVQIIPHYVLTGSGFGTFLDVFPEYKRFADSLIYDHAHNDYLELLIEGGLIGFLLLAWFLGAVLRRGWQQLCIRHDRQALLVALAALSGIAGLLFFSLTDFNLHNWANGFYLFFLCGLLISAGHTRAHSRQQTLLSPVTSPGKARAVLFLGAAVFLVVQLRFQGGELLAARHYERAHKVSVALSTKPEKQLARMAELLEQARKNAPFNGDYAYALANVRQYQQQKQQALQLRTAALRQQPLEGAFLQATGQALAETELAKAEILMETGYVRAKLKDGAFRIWVEFELAGGRRERATRIMRQELQEYPRLLNSISSLLLEYRFSRAETVAILPELTSAWLNCATLARSAGNEADAGYFTERALEFIDQEAKAQPQFFLQVYTYYQQHQQEEQAVAVLREGIRHVPTYALFHTYLGDYYQGKDIPYRAIEEYEQTLLIQPNDAAVQKKLQQLKRKQAGG